MSIVCFAWQKSWMTYWANRNEVALLRDYYHDHYADQMNPTA